MDRTKSVAQNLFTNARIAWWRRGQYRRLFDIPKDFVLRTATDPFSPRAKSALPFPLTLRPRAVSDRVYVRVANSDFVVFGEIFDSGEYAPVAGWNLPADARIVDLGANIGLASVYFGSLMPKASIVAVEPDAANCRLIEKNCRRVIQEGRLQIHRAFIAAGDGVAGLDRNRSSWAFQKVDTTDSLHETVPCISIQTLLESAKFEEIDLLKCDVEGTEAELFSQCGPWLYRVRHLVVETHKPYTVAKLYDHLGAANWRFEVAFEREDEFTGIAFLKRLTPTADDTGNSSSTASKSTTESGAGLSTP